jgi:hypothetical protein
MTDPRPTHVFEDISADLFQLGRLHVLVYADRLSGWPVVHRWRRDRTAREVAQAVIGNFVELGVPMRFRSDNGPQFDAGVLSPEETQHRSIAKATDYYSRGSGQSRKRVGRKDLPFWGFGFGGFSTRVVRIPEHPSRKRPFAAQMVFGQLRSIVPAHRSVYATCWKSVMDARDRQAVRDAESKTRYDLYSRSLPPLPIRANVRVQGPISKLWSLVGTIVPIGRYRAYRVKFASGSVLWRNRRFLRRLVEIDEGEETQESQESNSAEKSTPASTEKTTPHTIPPVPRRGERYRKPKIIVSM